MATKQRFNLIALKTAKAFFDYDIRVRRLVYAWHGEDIIGLHSDTREFRRLVARAMEHITMFPMALVNPDVSWYKNHPHIRTIEANERIDLQSIVI